MWPILKSKLSYYIKNSDEAIYIASYFIIINIIFLFNLGDKFKLIPELQSVGIWTGLFVCICLSSVPLYQRDADSGVLEIYQQLPISGYAIPIATWIAYYLSIMIPMLLALPIIWLIANQPFNALPHMAIGVAAGGFGITMIANLVASLSIGLKRGRAILLLLVFPLIIPILIFGAVYSAHSQPIWQPSLMFLLAYAVFMLPILCLAAASSIRSSN